MNMNYQVFQECDQFLSDEEKAKLLVQYYEPFDLDRYAVMYGKEPFTLCRRQRDKKTGRFIIRNVNILWSIQTQHVAGKPLAIYFGKTFGRIIAYDIDKNLDKIPLDQHALEREKLRENTTRFMKMLQSLGLEPMAYFSGKKGYHVEVRFSTPQRIADLRRLCKALHFKAEEYGVDTGCFDKIYPANGSSYKIFGTRHHDTRLFTGILTLDGDILDEQESWAKFSEYVDMETNNNSQAVQCLLNEFNHVIPLPKRKAQVKREAISMPSEMSTRQPRYTLEQLDELYNSGLKEPGTRHIAAYYLGSYIRRQFDYDLERTKLEVKNWLARHYEFEAMQKGLVYFGEASNMCLSKTFDACLKDTIESAANGWLRSHTPRKSELQYTPGEIEEFKLTMVKRMALQGVKHEKLFQCIEYILQLCRVIHSLTFYHSYEQFTVGFRTKNLGTIRAILSVLIENEFLQLIDRGNNIKGTANIYRLNLPSTTYRYVPLE